MQASCGNLSELQLHTGQGNPRALYTPAVIDVLASGGILIKKLLLCLTMSGHWGFLLLRDSGVFLDSRSADPSLAYVT